MLYYRSDILERKENLKIGNCRVFCILSTSSDGYYKIDRVLVSSLLVTNVGMPYETKSERFS